MNPLIICTLLFCTIHTNLSGANRVNVYIKCNTCDLEYIRTKLDYVSHVRDPAQSDIQLFIERLHQANYYIYNIRAIVSDGSANKTENLSFQIGDNIPKQEKRKNLIKHINIALIPYLLSLESSDGLEIIVKSNANNRKKKTIQSDAWNGWMLESYFNVGLNAESQRRRSDMELGLEADRITEEWRISGDLELSRNSRIVFDDQEKYRSTRSKKRLYTRVVKSINKHWSIGLFSGLKHDSYRNLAFSYFFEPAIEYNIFPYEEALVRELSFAYKIGNHYNKYVEPTLFDKEREALTRHSLELFGRFREPWGDVSAKFKAGTYMHDRSMYRLELDSYCNVRLAKGLAVRLSLDLELIRDQITLPAGEVGIEDLLLRQRQIATDFEIKTSIGVTYTFGSPFNNVVNTRL